MSGYEAPVTILLMLIIGGIGIGVIMISYEIYQWKKSTSYGKTVGKEKK